MSELSIVISLYNYNKPNNLEAVLHSISMSNLDIEVIISEQGTNVNSIYRKIAQKYNVVYILTEPDKKNDKTLYNIGRVRNVGASKCNSKYIYFTDADIIFYDKIYLQQIICLLETNPQNSYYKPQMYRLSEKDELEFIQDFCVGYNIKEPKVKDICYVNYDKMKSELVQDNEGEYKEIINKQPHVCKKVIYDKINSGTDFDYTNIEGFAWKANFHYGGTICRSKDFWNVGGYCESYYNWGLEDEDFQTKLSNVTELIRLDTILNHIPVVHIEHDTNYNNEIYEYNRIIFNDRLKKGIKQMIDDDINNKYSFFNKFINEKNI